MQLKVAEEAAQWYKDELELSDNDSLRFFVRYGGVGGLKPGFSLGVRPDTAQEPIAETTVDGVHFYIEQDDAWYFDNHSVKVTYDPKMQEPDFEYEEEQE
ncbi:HesB/YadR/YfhF family protein [Pontibacillus sp. HMF3514]|uniref:HesB/YadR/YfhF family protein n=1 Tax=Pontibacillus sp. HMF3514 TaxID=2692425 RepID=UPI00131FF38B|nr:HesB/YadR/YfhF family protein [Pontibacillus sp. HMF3514]QHE52317.1 hypothetical protein GS400_09840 [Pontibacillus sp. HMF3514]